MLETVRRMEDDFESKVDSNNFFEGRNRIDSVAE